MDLPFESPLPIEHLTIGALRGLRDIHLDRLGRVNLLVGPGNSGKTTVLEAVSLLSAPLNVAHWVSLSRARDSAASGLFATGRRQGDYLRWLFPHSPSNGDEPEEHGDIYITGNGTALVKSASASCIPVRGLVPVPRHVVYDPDGDPVEGDEEEEQLVEDDGWKFDFQCETRDLKEESDVSITFWTSGNSGMMPRNGPRFRCEFLPPYAHRSQPMQLRALTQAIKEDEKARLVDLLQQLDADILDLEIVSDRTGHRPVLSLRHRSAGLAPIDVFGDGVRRALMIALAVRECRGGVLLIDEIEAALHVTALDKLFPWLQRSCAEFNVQLFATTHSLEALSSISSCMDSQSSEVLAFHMFAQTENRSPKRYSSGMLQRLVHEGGLDIR